MGHRRFLPRNHRWRKQGSAFDGTKEINHPPVVPNGDDIMRQLENIEYVADMQKRKRTTEHDVDMQSIWKKRSIFFDLPYWKGNLLRHNLDVMHIEKNVVDNILGTLLNIDSKSKDNLQARLDLKEMGLRPELHPIPKASNKTYLPPASFTMSNVEKDDLLSIIKNVKMPDGYASNVSRCVKSRKRTIEGMKSHDGHILMQQLLPIALRKSISKKVAESLIELSAFFRGICSKTLRVEDLNRLESRIPYILCQLEMIFPPGFFTIMVHLTVHLVAECKLGGPVHYRWMYPVERYLHRLKFHVRNKAAPEGSISEGYLLEELLTFCSRYLESAQTVFNRPSRNPDDYRGEVVDIHLDMKSLMQAHRYILFNVDDFIPFRKIHMEMLRMTLNQNEISEHNLQKKHRDEFCEWFRDYVVDMDDTRRNELGRKIELHSKGLVQTAREFKRIVVNGTKFRTKNSKNGRTTQNSGVSVCTEDGSTWYGMLTRLIEVQYYDGSRYILFKCDWADMSPGRGYKEDNFGFSLVNFSRLIHTGERITDDPFVLSSQVSQVFYVANEREPNWVVVVKTKPRDTYDIGQEEMTDDEDEYILNEQNNLIIDDIIDVATDDVVWVRNDIEGVTIDLT
ncbi:hypothetical protein F2P56_001912 [Juglans regia]|uniref:Uncharacterized protein n=1 Tax=Juglans regia TaxID=51240 RepID=A0A833Y9D7_JUGRE|nr:hypothetical protein F2P56_001912 [Juglans regia]